ncbi:MAG: c-type cytochrome [Gaiellaceae bacterium]
MVLSAVAPPVPAASRLSGSLESCAVRHTAVIVAVAAAALGAIVLAGCGGQGVTTPTPATVIGTLPKAKVLPAVPATHLKGDSAKGSSVFASAGCGSCHTLAAAHSTGTVGPNLDDLKPDYQTVTSQVTNGGGGMPSFGTGSHPQLTTQQIADVAAYVVDSTGGKAP